MSTPANLDVLVVDDRSFFLEVAADKLEGDSGIQAHAVESGTAALSILAEKSIDCIVSDYRMPDMDGLELYRRIESEYGLPFILLTAEGDEAVASEAISVGINDYLMKESIVGEGSQNFELLTNRIKNVVSRYQARHKYERLVNNTPDQIVEVTLEGTILAVNGAMAQSVGEDKTDIEGRELTEVLPEEVATNRLKQAQRAVTAGTAVTFQDTIGLRHFHNIAVPLSATSIGDTVQFITREITQQKRHEQELENRTEELAVINRIVRHDINNDIQLLQTWSDLLSNHVDEEGREYVERIDDTCSHIVELTATVRDFIQAFQNEDDIDLEPIDIAILLRDEVTKKRERFDDATITIDGEVPSVAVRANELLSSVLSNVLNNAVRHNDSEQPRVTVSVTEEESMVRIAVADDGPGVPDDRKEAIFGKGEMGPESPGTGIGLYLVHSLVEQYGGSVWVEDNTNPPFEKGSEEAQGAAGSSAQSDASDANGAIFYITLPKHAEQTATWAA